MDCFGDFFIRISLFEADIDFQDICLTRVSIDLAILFDYF